MAASTATAPSGAPRLYEGRWTDAYDASSLGRKATVIRAAVTKQADNRLAGVSLLVGAARALRQLAGGAAREPGRTHLGVGRAGTPPPASARGRDPAARVAAALRAAGMAAPACRWSCLRSEPSRRTRSPRRSSGPAPWSEKNASLAELGRCYGALGGAPAAPAARAHCSPAGGTGADRGRPRQRADRRPGCGVIGAHSPRARVRGAQAPRGRRTARRPPSRRSSGLDWRCADARSWPLLRILRRRRATAQRGTPKQRLAARDRRRCAAGGAGSGAWVGDGSGPRCLSWTGGQQARTRIRAEALHTADRAGPAGAGRRFETAVLADGPIAEGVLEGDLYLRGSRGPALRARAALRGSAGRRDRPRARSTAGSTATRAMFDRRRGGRPAASASRARSGRCRRCRSTAGRCARWRAASSRDPPCSPPSACGCARMRSERSTSIGAARPGGRRPKRRRWPRSHRRRSRRSCGTPTRCPTTTTPRCC